MIFPIVVVGSWERSDVIQSGFFVFGVLKSFLFFVFSHVFSSIVYSLFYIITVYLQDEYMSLPGLFPTVAGKIASHGPYSSVKDMYKIEGLTARDKKMMQKYESEFTVNPASLRTFNERINARVST